MRILVTGASGVIGLRLVQYLAETTDAEIDAAYFSSCASLRALSSKTPHRINIHHYSRILEQFRPSQYDQIWHLATYGQPARFIDSWQQVVALNSQHLIMLSKLIKDGGLFLYASTSEIYSSIPCATEDAVPSSKPSGPRSIYTESKRLGEAICSTLFPKENHLIFRICLAYSDSYRLDDRRVLYELTTKGLVDKSIRLIDDGSSKRQYIYVDDAIRMMADISRDQRRLAYEDSVFNIANHEQITILDLANHLGSIIGCDVIPGPTHNPLGALDLVEVIPKRYLELYPNFQFTSLPHGLKLVVEKGRKMLANLQE